MKVFMIGGTGLLGSEAAKVLIAGGHEVTSIALPPLPAGCSLPPEMKIDFGNYLKMTDDEIKAKFAGCEGFVFAAGIDERVEGTAPIYDMFKKYNIDPINRLLPLAKASGVKHVVILGSYFSYFAKTRPQDRLTEWHPYIRSRIDQEKAAMSYDSKGFDVAVLEHPYIFGTQPGRKPVWMFLVQSIRSMKKVTLYSRGGTAMVTVHQVGEAIAGALERNKGGNCYPIGYYNMTWKQMLAIVHKYLGFSGRKVITIPNWMYAMSGRQLMRQQKKRNIQGGLNMVKFTKLQCSDLFIDKSLGCVPLSVGPDDIDKAIGASIDLCVEIADKKVKALDMKAE